MDMLISDAGVFLTTLSVAHSFRLWGLLNSDTAYYTHGMILLLMSSYGSFLMYQNGQTWSTDVPLHYEPFLITGFAYLCSHVSENGRSVESISFALNSSFLAIFGHLFYSTQFLAIAVILGLGRGNDAEMMASTHMFAVGVYMLCLKSENTFGFLLAVYLIHYIIWKFSCEKTQNAKITAISSVMHKTRYPTKCALF